VRIIAGAWKGRTLAGPAVAGVRPTSDGLRETLFNVLQGRVAGARVLDGFAGTGAVGLEALSRGALHATFVESDRRVAEGLERNVARCGAGDRSTLLRDRFVGVSVRRGLTSFDIVFLDPPYDAEDLAAVASEGVSLLAPTGTLVIEHSRRRAAPHPPPGVERDRVLVAGDSALAFYRAVSAADTMSATEA
jgi:16S rRNA (guanine(966)-N(2))-methyltransferase RsmD